MGPPSHSLIRNRGYVSPYVIPFQKAKVSDEVFQANLFPGGPSPRCDAPGFYD